MDSPVARFHPEGVLRKQNVPPILPADNKYMCAVDRTSQLGKNYDLDRKSRRFWLCLMNRLFNMAVNNSYRHSCKRHRLRGRYRQCVLSKTKKPRHTSFGCGVCRVRLCKYIYHCTCVLTDINFLIVFCCV